MQYRKMPKAYQGIVTEDRKSYWTSDCIDCGKCEQKCPQHIEVRKEFLKVQRDLEGSVTKGLHHLPER